MLRRVSRRARALVVALILLFCLSVSYMNWDREVSRGRARGRAGAGGLGARRVKTSRRRASAQVAGGARGLTEEGRP